MRPGLTLFRTRSLDVTHIGTRGLLGPTAEGALLCAPLVGSAIALGAFQRAQSTLDFSRLEGSGTTLVRRATGGPALAIGRGQIYVLLELRRPDAFQGSADPSRLLNRHVRPLLTALSVFGTKPAVSGGRDVVTMDGAPLAWAGAWHDSTTGRCGIEAVVASEQTFVLPTDIDLAAGQIAPRWLGREPRTLTEQLGAAVEPARIVQAIAHAYATVDSEVELVEPPRLERSRVHTDEAPFTAMVEEAIGLLGAVVEPKQQRIGLGGDAMVSTDRLQRLGEVLYRLGPTADEETIATTVHDVLLGDGRGMLLGVREPGRWARAVSAAWSVWQRAETGTASR